MDVELLNDRGLDVCSAMLRSSMADNKRAVVVFKAVDVLIGRVGVARLLDLRPEFQVGLAAKQNI